MFAELTSFIFDRVDYAAFGANMEIVCVIMHHMRSFFAITTSDPNF